MTDRKPLIGITTEFDERGEYTLPGEYVAAVRRAGGIPVLIPGGEADWEQILALLDGLILSGGGDVHPEHYGSPGHPAVYAVDPQRDALELTLAREAVVRQLPALCVCRGAQVLNVALGGTLIEHLPDEVGEDIAHRNSPPGYTRHPIAVEPGSRLAAILGATTVQAASWHHQAIRQPAPALAVTAHAADGTIEAAELPGHPWLVAVQWHPEITSAEDPIQQRLFDAFVAAARQTRLRPTG